MDVESYIIFWGSISPSWCFALEDQLQNWRTKRSAEKSEHVKLQTIRLMLTPASGLWESMKQISPKEDFGYQKTTNLNIILKVLGGTMC